MEVICVKWFFLFLVVIPGCFNLSTEPLPDPGLIIIIENDTWGGGALQVEIYEKFDHRERWYEFVLAPDTESGDSFRFSARGFAEYTITFIIPKYKSGRDLWKLEAAYWLTTDPADPPRELFSPPLDSHDWEWERLN